MNTLATVPDPMYLDDPAKPMDIHLVINEFLRNLVRTSILALKENTNVILSYFAAGGVNLTPADAVALVKADSYDKDSYAPSFDISTGENYSFDHTAGDTFGGLLDESHCNTNFILYYATNSRFTENLAFDYGTVSPDSCKATVTMSSANWDKLKENTGSVYYYLETWKYSDEGQDRRDSLHPGTAFDLQDIPPHFTVYESGTGCGCTRMDVGSGIRSRW